MAYWWEKSFLPILANHAGGPLREYFRLLVGEVLSKNNLFHGSDTARIPTHNAMELAKKTYFHVGQVFALSLVNGGPAPKCMADAVADYIVYGIEKVKASTKDVPDVEIRMKLQQVSWSHYCGQSPYICYTDIVCEVHIQPLLDTLYYSYAYTEGFGNYI